MTRPFSAPKTQTPKKEGKKTVHNLQRLLSVTRLSAVHSSGHTWGVRGGVSDGLEQEHDLSTGSQPSQGCNVCSASVCV